MILIDTSVWIDHLRSPVSRLFELLDRSEVLGHPLVKGEIAMGNFKQRKLILVELENLPPAEVADHEEVVRFVSRHSMFGRGIGFVDAHILVATRLTPDAILWTRDQRLKRIAEEMGVSYSEG